jgi:protease I
MASELNGKRVAILAADGVERVELDKLRMDEDAVRFVRDFFNSGKPIGTICHGPWTLVEAGVVSGRQITSFPSVRTDTSAM